MGKGWESQTASHKHALTVGHPSTASTWVSTDSKHRARRSLWSHDKIELLLLDSTPGAGVDEPRHRRRSLESSPECAAANRSEL